MSKFEEDCQNITFLAHIVITRNLLDILVACKLSCILKTFQDKKAHILYSYKENKV
jgi:hypothetical protein